MLDFIKNIFGTPVDYKALVNQGAVIVDVRSKNEYQGGHIRNAINIPLQEIGSQLAKIKKDKPVILCCASGMRSSSAKSILKTRGYEAYNGGSWLKLQKKLEK